MKIETVDGWVARQLLNIGQACLNEGRPDLFELLMAYSQEIRLAPAAAASTEISMASERGVQMPDVVAAPDRCCH